MRPKGIVEGACDENSPIDDDLHIRTCRAVPGSSSLMVSCDEAFGKYNTSRVVVYMLVLGVLAMICAGFWFWGQTLRLVGPRRAGCFPLSGTRLWRRDEYSLPSLLCGQSSSL